MAGDGDGEVQQGGRRHRGWAATASGRQGGRGGDNARWGGRGRRRGGAATVSGRGHREAGRQRRRGGAATVSGRGGDGEVAAGDSARHRERSNSGRGGSATYIAKALLPVRTANRYHCTPFVPIGATNRDQRALFGTAKGGKRGPLISVGGTNRDKRRALVPVGGTNRYQRGVFVRLAPPTGTSGTGLIFYFLQLFFSGLFLQLFF